MKKPNLLLLVSVATLFVGFGCASNNNNGSYSRAGRPYQEPRAMNNRNLDSESLYQACLRERPEVSCRNRMGR